MSTSVETIAFSIDIASHTDRGEDSYLEVQTYILISLSKGLTSSLYFRKKKFFIDSSFIKPFNFLKYSF